MLSAMAEAGVREDFARTHVTTLVRGAAVGAIGIEPPTFRQLFESLGQIWGTYHYDHYLDLFGIDALVGKRFYNLGSGGFRHPIWTNVDYKSAHYSGTHIDIHWDAENMPVDAPSGQAGAVYTSHTIEHLQNKGAANLFNEAYRLLQSGGVFRVTCPEFEYYYEGVQSVDRYRYSSQIPQGFDSAADAVIANFLAETASQVSPVFKDAWAGTAAMKAVELAGLSVPDPVSPNEFRQMIDTKGRDEAILEITRRVDIGVHQHMLGGHVNFWPYNRIAEFGRQAGFQTIYRSAYGQSRCPIFQDTRYFDTTVPHISVYVEMVK